MRPQSLALLTNILLILIPTIQARQPPTSFCKCICFQNSTIIPLNSPPKNQARHVSTINPRIDNEDIPPSLLSPRQDTTNDDTTTNPSSSSSSSSTHRTLTCNDCNRAFCLDYNLAICKNAKEEDVFTSCFQRDSLKDLFVIVLFLLLTSSLLTWAILKPYIQGFWSGTGGGIGNMKIGGRGGGGGRLPVSINDTNAVRGDGSGRYDDVDREEEEEGNGEEYNSRGGGKAAERDVNSRLVRQGGLNS